MTRSAPMLHCEISFHVISRLISKAKATEEKKSFSLLGLDHQTALDTFQSPRLIWDNLGRAPLAALMSRLCKAERLKGRLLGFKSAFIICVTSKPSLQGLCRPNQTFK